MVVKPTYEELERLFKERTSELTATKEQLWKSEEKFSFLPGMPSITFYQTDAQGRCIYASPAWCKQTGLTLEETLGDGWKEGIHPDDRENVFRSWEKMVRSGGKWSCEYRYRPIAGKTIWVHGTAVETYDENGNITGYTGANLDISGLKQLEEKLRKSENSLAMAQEVADVGSWDWDLEKGTLTWSDKTYRQFGLEPNEIVPTYKTFETFIHPDDFDRVNKRVKQAIDGERPYSVAIRVISRDGREWLMHVRGEVYRDDKGRAIRFVGTQQDITERKQAEEKLLLQSEMMANLSEGICLVGHDNGIILFTNSKFEEMFGYDHGEMIGKHISIVNAPTEISPKQTAKKIMGILHKTGKWKGEVNNIRKDGTSFWCYASVSVFNHSKHGGVQVVVHRDITEHKKAEDALKKAYYELEQKTLNLKEINVALKVLLEQREADKNNLQKKVLSNVRKLVFPYLEKLTNSSLDTRQKVYLEIVERNLKDVIAPFNPKISDTLSLLTLAEIQVADLTKQGKTTKEIASLFALSPATISTHKQNIRKKLGLTNKKMNLRTILTAKLK